MSIKNSNQCNHFWKLNELNNNFVCQLCNDISPVEKLIFKRMNWIKCSDRMPDHLDLVLIYDPNYPESVAAEYDHKNRRWFENTGTACGCCQANINPICWLPMPEPPKDDL